MPELSRTRLRSDVSMFARLWRWIRMELTAAAEVVGHALKAALNLSVEPLPTLSINVVSPTGQVYVGDQVVVSLTDSDGAPVTGGTLAVNGTAVTASPDGTFTFVAA